MFVGLLLYFKNKINNICNCFSLMLIYVYVIGYMWNNW